MMDNIVIITNGSNSSWCKHDDVAIISLGNREDVRDISLLIPCDNTLPFFGIEYNTLRMFDKETLKEISHVDPFQVREIFRKNKNNYTILEEVNSKIMMIRFEEHKNL